MTTPLETLEPRRLFAAAAPTDVEQYLVELINRARANPAAEAARFGIDLNEGLPAGTISTAPKPLLAVNPFLTDAARGHSQWMLDNDVFSHTGAGNSTPTQRMQAAGYVLTPPASTGENIAYRGTRPSVPDPVATTARLLFVDLNYPQRGHRTNMLAEGHREVGAGVATGQFNEFNAVMATEDFASSGTGTFLTGVAYTDGVVDDDFYTPGEGLGGVTVTAVRTSDAATYATTTYASGGYSLRVPAGTYAITAAGVGLPGVVRFGSVAVGAQNVKRDFLPELVIATPTAVADRSVFYNNSAFDGFDPAATPADLSAVAPDKRALRPGGVSSFANVTSYTRGINGVLVDFAGVPDAPLSRDDFSFRAGPGINPALWAEAPAPTNIVALPTPTASNTARYAITWPDGAIRNSWLQVTVKANADTGLAADDVFYFGNLVGETGDAGTATPKVNALDLAIVKQSLARPATIESRTDFNRDGRTNALDVAAVKGNLTRELPSFTPRPAGAPDVLDPAGAPDVLNLAAAPSSLLRATDLPPTGRGASVG